MIDLDGTANKSRLGAQCNSGGVDGGRTSRGGGAGIPLFESLGEGNGTLLPLPEIQIVGGGAHADWRTDIQDFLLIATGAKTFNEVMEITYNVYHAAGDLMKKRGTRYGVADEGGYWPEFLTNEEAIQFMVHADRIRGLPTRQGSPPSRSISGRQRSVR